MSSKSMPRSPLTLPCISPSYVNDLEQRRPNVHAMRLRHLFTRRASSAPVTLAWHDIPTSATLVRPRAAASVSARGLAEYV